MSNEGARRVMHCDLDCFFAAVEELDNPSLRGKAVIVGGDPDKRGVVSTANYVARRYGVHSAMSAAVARRLCPHAVFLRPRFERYRELSQRVMTILDDYFLVREQVSVDEAYGELAPAGYSARPMQDIGAEIRQRVLTEVGLVISIGAGRTKSIAKLASDYSKPDGLLIIKPAQELPFLHPLPVGRLNGVGPHTRERLEKLGIHTIGDIATTDINPVQRLLGKHGGWLWDVANGRDDRPVVADRGPTKSVSHEDTFERDIADLDRAAAHVRTLAGQVAARASKKRLIGRSVTLKVKWADFRLMTRQQSLRYATSSEEPITEAALSLLKDEIGPLIEAGSAIRLLGVSLGGMISLDASEEQTPARAAYGYVQAPLPFLELSRPWRANER